MPAVTNLDLRLVRHMMPLVSASEKNTIATDKNLQGNCTKRRSETRSQSNKVFSVDIRIAITLNPMLRPKITTSDAVTCLFRRYCQKTINEAIAKPRSMPYPKKNEMSSCGPQTDPPYPQYDVTN